MSYDLMFQKAIELQNAGALNQAEEIYFKMLQVMPENSDVWNLLGLIAQSKNDLAQATDCFLNAIKYAPAPFFAHYFNLGLTYKALQKPKEAIEALEKALTLKADLKEAANLLGILFAEQDDKKRAVQYFCKALEIDENYEEARANLCYYTNDLLTLFKLSDEHPDIFMVSYLAALSSQDFENKEKYLLRAIAADTERSEALLALADLYKQQENFNKALTFYHKVLNLENNNIWAILGVADCYLALKDFDKAEQFYLKSFTQSREIAGAHINYATLLYQQNRLAEALEEYRTAVQLAPEKPEISYNLALILKETGDIEEALGLMFNAHLKAPENEIFAINLMETLATLYHTQAEKALKIAENWQKSEPNNVFSQRLLSGIAGTTDEANNASYAEKLFDAFAETYDETLDKLTPQIINQFIETHGIVCGKVLDLGCGTGLAAFKLKHEKNHFDGVDVSANMLEQARSKNLYDNLYHADIIDFLNTHKLKDYDLITAFDVFCYFGDLAPIFKKLKGQNVWFSVEAADNERAQNFYSTPTGRYKHKRSYLEKLLRELKFSSVEFYELALRQENSEDVMGWLIEAK